VGAEIQDIVRGYARRKFDEVHRIPHDIGQLTAVPEGQDEAAVAHPGLAGLVHLRSQARWKAGRALSNLGHFIDRQAPLALVVLWPDAPQPNIRFRLHDIYAV